MSDYEQQSGTTVDVGLDNFEYEQRSGSTVNIELQLALQLESQGRSGASGGASASATLSLTTTAASGVTAGAAGPTARVTEAVGRSGTTGGSVGIVSRPIRVAVGRSGVTGAAGETTQSDGRIVGRSGTTGVAVSMTTASRPALGRSGSTGGATALGVTIRPAAGRSGASGGARETAERPLWIIERFGASALAVDPTTGLAATPNTLSIEAVVAGPTRESATDLATEAVGDFDTGQGFAGAFRTISRSGDPARQVLPADSESPAFGSTRGHLSVVELSEMSPSHAELSIEIERASNRDGSTAQSATLDTGSTWSVGLNGGAGPTLSLAAGQVGQLTTAGNRAGESVRLPLKLSTQQTGVLLDTVGYPEGVVNESVGDGRDGLVDETGGRQTLTLSAPDNAAIDNGTWFVTDWELTFGSIDEDRQWLVELTLSQNR